MLKRGFDLLTASIGLLLLSPLLAAISVAVKVDSPGSAFHRGERVGRNGVPFRVYKFRSMVIDAAQKGPGITASGDTRITKVGRVLRRTKLDEIPQLLNIVRGEMSLVGPRPEDARFVAMYTPEQRQVLGVRPGITSLASVAYRNEEEVLDVDNWEEVYIHRVMPDKLAMELDYLDRQTFWGDLGILASTALALLR